MRRLAILGASGHGKVVADCAECAGWNDVVFFDDAWPNIETNGAWCVIGNTDQLLNDLEKFDGVIIAIGDNLTRLEKYSELLAHGASMVSIVHPDAKLSRYVKLGIGSVVMAGAIINVDTTLGVSCIVNTGATIDHDCTLGDGVHVSPGAHLAGGVTVENGAWIGIGANIRQMIHIGKYSVVAAGAVVVNDIVEECTVAGVPAKSLT